MADMYGAVRSNVFKVKDYAAFKAWFDANVRFGDEVHLFDDNDEDGAAFGGYEQYPSAWPHQPADPDDDQFDGYAQWDLEAFAVEVRKYLQPGEELRVLAAGHEKLRYVGATHLRITATEAVFTDLYEGN